MSRVWGSPVCTRATRSPVWYVITGFHLSGQARAGGQQQGAVSGGGGGQGAGGGAGDGTGGGGGVVEDGDLGVAHGVGPVAVGGEPEDAAAGAGEAGDALLAAFAFVGGVLAVADDDQQAGGTGAGQGQGVVEGVDGLAELFGAVGSCELGDLGGDVAGAGE